MVSIHSRMVQLRTERCDRALAFSTDRLSHDELVINDKNNDLVVDLTWLRAQSLTRKMIGSDSHRFHDCVRFGCCSNGFSSDTRLASELVANYLTDLNFVNPPCHPPCLCPPFPSRPSTPL